MSEIESRKQQHVELAMSAGAESRASALWEDVELLPVSVPDMVISDIDLTTEFLGHTLSTPLLITGMTGGYDHALEINRNLAAVADELGVAIGTGSQRAALVNPALESTYSVVREQAPGAFVMANIGMSQLVTQGDDEPFDRADIERAVAMVEADALAVHLNAVEELIQPEGDRNMAGLSQAIARCVQWSSVPVVGKETGAGMTRETATGLAEAGLAALDVGGVGGTSFALIEGSRAEAVGDERGARLGRTFGEFGVPTALAILEARAAGLPLIATGGVRNGLHIAKALALGATLVGIGGPIIRAARHGAEAAVIEVQHLIEELKVAMVLTGSSTVERLGRNEPVLMGRAAEWVHARGGPTPDQP